MSKERMLWVLTIFNLCLLFVHFNYNVSKKHDNMYILIETYKARTALLSEQLNEYTYSLSNKKAEQYNMGFEAGKTQAAIVLMNKHSLYEYADGYHAALTQFGEVDEVTPAQDIIDGEKDIPSFPGTKKFREQLSRDD